MILRLKAGTHLELPYTISRAGVIYILAPDSDKPMPDEIAQALIKTYPDLYQEATGTPDKAQYKFSDKFKNKSIQDLAAKLPNDKKLQLFDVAKRLLEGKPIAEPVPGPDLTEEEEELLQIFRKLEPDDRGAVLKYVSKK